MIFYPKKENIKIALNKELEILLSEEFDSVIKREKESFDRLAEPFEKSIVLFGSGQLGRKTLAGLRTLGIEPLAFADNNSNLWHQYIDNLIVLSPEEAADKFGDKAVFIVTIWRACSTHRLAHTREQLQRLNCQKVVSCAFLFWKYSQIFLPHYCLDLPHKVFLETENIKKAFYLLADERSQSEYLAQLRWRILLDFDNLPSPIPQEQYFRQDIFNLSPDDVFVDCGSYDGDTIKQFLKYQNSFTGKIIALEPDQKNFTKLEEYVYSLTSIIREKITLFPLAVGKQKERLRFAATGTASSVITELGTIEVDCVTLDELLSNCIPSIIKMDIEGAEIDAILGAKILIQKYSPILAISVYHCQNHLWQIPLLIQSLSNQYRFFLSPHGEECWDLVFYAVPMSRLKL
ncbi:FkbM family methyltransferase [Calothrix sp. NIES-2098]|uniref:FkbM family methyltransferase n=1 Tax=Calothrix sp. NIES-2098 TaxID=1954171 RepID=UPI000B615056|nr:FkbM family methyltransferase [Calothrix sp. NIES-2098]